MGEFLDRLLWRLADLFALAGGFILLAIIAVTTTNTGAFIADRIAGAFGGSVSGLPGYEDFVRLAISSAGLMFFPYCQLQRGHVVVDLFADLAPHAVQRGLDRLWLAISAVTAAFLAWWMVIGLEQKRADGAITSVLGWPEWPFYAPGIVSLALWALIAISQVFERPTGDEAVKGPPHDA